MRGKVSLTFMPGYSGLNECLELSGGYGGDISLLLRICRIKGLVE